MPSFKDPIVNPDLDLAPFERNAVLTLNQRPADGSGLRLRVANPK